MNKYWKDILLDFACGIKETREIEGTETVSIETFCLLFVNYFAQIEFSPWMVKVIGLDWMGYGMICGGSIIASKYVITAAHCIINASFVIVELGGFYPGDMKMTKIVKRIIPHPEYNKTKHENDIAILEVLIPIDLNIYTPVCFNNTFETFDWKIAEWNSESPERPRSPQLAT